jgi:hypothetical protein
MLRLKAELDSVEELIPRGRIKDCASPAPGRLKASSKCMT